MKYMFAADLKSFDSSVHEWLIRQAFNTLRTHFPNMNQEDTEIWNKLIDEFINTKFIMPDGAIYQKDGGIPSGSFFTQLIGSIISASIMI